MQAPSADLILSRLITKKSPSSSASDSTSEARESHEIVPYEFALQRELVRLWWEKVKAKPEENSEDQDDELTEWINWAFLGATACFVDRDLIPIHPDHMYLWSFMKQEVTEIHQKITQEHLLVDPAELKFQLYDYGIQCVYYLEWKLYISQECY